MDIHNMLRSSCRLKILKALSAKKEVNMMRLVRTVNSTYNEVDRNLRILEDENMITQQYFGRKRIIRLNLENKKTQLLLKAMRLLETPADHNNLEVIVSQNTLKETTATNRNAKHVRNKTYN